MHNPIEPYQKKSWLRMQQSFSSMGSSASIGVSCGGGGSCGRGSAGGGGGGGAGSSREFSSSKSASKRVGLASRRSERKEMRDTCSSCSDRPPDGELPSAAAAAFDANAGAAEARRALPARGRGVLVFIIAGDRPGNGGEGSLSAVPCRLADSKPLRQRRVSWGCGFRRVCGVGDGDGRVRKGRGINYLGKIEMGGCGAVQCWWNWREEEGNHLRHFAASVLGYGLSAHVAFLS